MQIHGWYLVDQQLPHFQGRKIKCLVTHLITSPRRRSMRWLFTEVAAIKLPLLIPRSGQFRINRETSTFSTPKSSHTLDRRPWIEIASRNRCTTVAAKLLLLYCKYVISRFYPSNAPYFTIHQHIDLWWPSICLEKKYFIFLISKRSLS